MLPDCTLWNGWSCFIQAIPSLLLILSSSQHFTFRIFQSTPIYSSPSFYSLAFYYSILYYSLSRHYPSFYQSVLFSDAFQRHCHYQYTLPLNISACMSSTRTQYLFYIFLIQTYITCINFKCILLSIDKCTHLSNPTPIRTLPSF